MDNQRYNVVLTGSTENGLPATAVALALSRLINRDDAFAFRLLRGEATTIKSGVDSGEYADALQRIGAAVRIEPQEVLEIDPRVGVPPQLRDGAEVAKASPIPIMAVKRAEAEAPRRR